MHPQWRGSDDNGTERVGVNPFLLVRFPKSQRGLFGLSKDPGGLQKQHQHHHRSNISDHHPVEFLAAEGLAVALHLVNDVSGVMTQPIRMVDSRAMKGIITLLLT